MGKCCKRCLICTFLLVLIGAIVFYALNASKKSRVGVEGKQGETKTGLQIWNEETEWTGAKCVTPSRAVDKEIRCHGTKTLPKIEGEWGTILYARMTGNTWPTITNNRLQALPSLLELDLSNNGILKILDNAFSALFQLQVLNLRKNRLVTIDAYVFTSNLKTVRALLLDRNQIQYLYANQFKFLSGLYTLNISRNNLKQIASGQFKDTLSLGTLDLRGGNYAINCSSLVNVPKRITVYAPMVCTSNNTACKGVECSDNQECKDIGDGNYECSCAIGYKGKYCDTDIDECQRQPCSQDANCLNSEGSFKCSLRESKNQAPTGRSTALNKAQIVLGTILGVLLLAFFTYHRMMKAALAKGEEEKRARDEVTEPTRQSQQPRKKPQGAKKGSQKGRKTTAAAAAAAAAGGSRAVRKRPTTRRATRVKSEKQKSKQTTLLPAENQPQYADDRAAVNKQGGTVAQE